MKKLPNFVKWIIILAALAAMGWMMWAVNDRASRVEMPAPVLPASAKQARSKSVRLCQGEKPSGAMWAPRRQSSTAVFPVGRHGLPRKTVPAGQPSETKSQSQNTKPSPSAEPEGAVT